jgi:hypothetical protein
MRRIKDKIWVILKLIGSFVLAVVLLFWFGFISLYLLKPIASLLSESLDSFLVFTLVVTYCIVIVYVGIRITQPLFDKAYIMMRENI